MTTDPRDLLSAYLDGELSTDERETVDAALDRSADLRHELEELSATRAMLRGLPAVAPVRPIEAPQPATTGRSRRYAGAVLAVAAVWLVVLSLGVGLGRLPVVPDVEQLSAQHAAAEPMAGFAPMDMAEMDDPAIMDEIDGMARDAIYMRDDVVHVRYSDGSHDVSVFHQPGSVDWDDMPDMGKVDMMADGPVWRGVLDGQTVVVTERGDLIVTVVADGDMDEGMAMHASEKVPEVDKDESFWSKLRAAPGNLWNRVFA